ERDGAAAVHDPAGTDQPTRPRGAQEVDLQLQRGCELARLERGDEGWAHRVVEHRREEAALDVAHRVAERGPGVEGEPDRAGGRIDLLDRPAERLGRRRPRDAPGYRVPERAGAAGGDGVHVHASVLARACDSSAPPTHGSAPKGWDPLGGGRRLSYGHQSIQPLRMSPDLTPPPPTPDRPQPAWAGPFCPARAAESDATGGAARDPAQVRSGRRLPAGWRR